MKFFSVLWKWIFPIAFILSFLTILFISFSFSLKFNQTYDAKGAGLSVEAFVTYTFTFACMLFSMNGNTVNANAKLSDFSFSSSSIAIGTTEVGSSFKLGSFSPNILMIVAFGLLVLGFIFVLMGRSKIVLSIVGLLCFVGYFVISLLNGTLSQSASFSVEVLQKDKSPIVNSFNLPFLNALWVIIVILSITFVDILFRLIGKALSRADA